MPKAKVGDRIRIVDALMSMGQYMEGDEGKITALCHKDREGVMVFFDHYEEGEGSMYVLDGEYEVIKNDADTSFPDRKEEHLANKDAPASSAEAIRDNILRIREKRNDLKMEIIALDKEEADCVEKLKNMGFVLHEGAISSDSAEEKTVLYADDIEEDMTDPYNWEVGDIIECIDTEIAPVGSLATIIYIADDRIYRTGGDGFIDGCFSSNSRGLWKFHSRPL